MIGPINQTFYCCAASLPVRAPCLKVFPETRAADAWRALERGDDRLGCDERSRPQWDQVANRYTVASDGERMALFNRAYDSTALIAQLPLTDSTAHDRNVKRARYERERTRDSSVPLSL